MNHQPLMNNRNKLLPLQSCVRPGAILSSIAHAIYVGRVPLLSHEQSWDGCNYSVQDSAGSRGTISFNDDKFVAVFFDASSDRNPFRGNQKIDAERYLVGLPQELRLLAQDEAMQYVLEEVNENAIPIITTAFWGDGKDAYIQAGEEWADVYAHGAWLVRNQLLKTAEALDAWKSDLELTPTELALVSELFKLKTDHPNETIVLTKEQISALRLSAATEEGWFASQESFAELNITIPKFEIESTE